MMSVSGWLYAGVNLSWAPSCAPRTSLSLTFLSNVVAYHRRLRWMLLHRRPGFQPPRFFIVQKGATLTALPRARGRIPDGARATR